MLKNMKDLLSGIYACGSVSIRLREYEPMLPQAWHDETSLICRPTYLKEIYPPDNPHPLRKVHAPAQNSQPSIYPSSQ